MHLLCRIDHFVLSNIHSFYLVFKSFEQLCISTSHELSLRYAIKRQTSLADAIMVFKKDEKFADFEDPQAFEKSQDCISCRVLGEPCLNHTSTIDMTAYVELQAQPLLCLWAATPTFLGCSSFERVGKRLN